MRALLSALCLLLALPVLGVLGAWLALDAAAMATLAHQASNPGQTKYDMFSTTPSTRCLVICAIFAALIAVRAAASCGVVTMMSSAPGIIWAMVRAMSPVPGGQVDEEVVGAAPEDVAEELLDGAAEHGAAPHDRLVVREEEAHGDDLHAVGLGREHLAVVRLGRDGRQAHHERDGRSVDVGVDEGDRVALRARARSRGSR